MSSSTSSPDFPPVDSRIWRACAGSSVRIPAVNSRVYYFPQGHLEQSSSASSPALSPIALSRPYVACVVAAVSFHADPLTDEVFARLVLHPSSSGGEALPEARGYAVDEEDEKIASFAKVLTSSDANNGGGFSVPRFCADTIFPPLNYQIDPPVQNLEVTDVHGVVWTFRHIYRGTPRRHLLTTGWSKFVNNKKLVAGDSVLFMKNSGGDIFVGIRRATRVPGADCFTWRNQIAAGKTKIEEDSVLKESFSRNGRGRVPLESVVKAIEHAARGMPFEVIYYPRAGWSDFVVRADVVEASMKSYLAAGVRVKMAVETEDTSRMTWFQGTVSSTAMPENGPWAGSPWRMVQVIWDEPDVLPNSRSLNPWQLEPLSIQSAFPPTKKFRASGLGPDGGDAELYFPLRGFASSTLGHLSPSLLNYNISPAGMQGARQDAIGASSFLHYADENTPPKMFTADFLGNKMFPNYKSLPAGLNIESSPSENLSTDSPNSGRSSIADLAAQKVPANCIQLFGQFIYIEKPVESGSDDDGLKESIGTANAEEYYLYRVVVHGRRN
ncbi:hypothetical protein CRG98_018566 [Punica granatum]|uniref:Auxin response factor n=1 Tax=Punica granatum TaxID=22663 RepID=A0A2I0JXN6_PUNGR|nr:hypothetical protein CRG98_018566 [Punica granatum]